MRDTACGDFEGQGFLVDRFQEAFSQGSMHLHRCADDRVGMRIAMRAGAGCGLPKNLLTNLLEGAGWPHVWGIYVPCPRIATPLHPRSIRQIEQLAPSFGANLTLDHLARGRAAEEGAADATQAAAWGRLVVGGRLRQFRRRLRGGVTRRANCTHQCEPTRCATRLC